MEKAWRHCWGVGEGVDHGHVSRTVKRIWLMDVNWWWYQPLGFPIQSLATNPQEMTMKSPSSSLTMLLVLKLTLILIQPHQVPYCLCGILFFILSYLIFLCIYSTSLVNGTEVSFAFLSISAFYLDCLVHLHLMEVDIVGFPSITLTCTQVDTASSPSFSSSSLPGLGSLTYSFWALVPSSPAPSRWGLPQAQKTMNIKHRRIVGVW